MLKHYRYKNNLLVAYRTAMSVFLFAFLPVGLITAITVFISLQRYQQRSAKAYVFHTGGASIEIYEPSGSRQRAGQAVLAGAKRRGSVTERRPLPINP